VCIEGGEHRWSPCGPARVTDGLIDFKQITRI
jgi:hypothetical protein